MDFFDQLSNMADSIGDSNKDYSADFQKFYDDFTLPVFQSEFNAIRPHYEKIKKFLEDNNIDVDEFISFIDNKYKNDSYSSDYYKRLCLITFFSKDKNDMSSYFSNLLSYYTLECADKGYDVDDIKRLNEIMNKCNSVGLSKEDIQSIISQRREDFNKGKSKDINKKDDDSKKDGKKDDESKEKLRTVDDFIKYLDEFKPSSDYDKSSKKLLSVIDLDDNTRKILNNSENFNKLKEVDFSKIKCMASIVNEDKGLYYYHVLVYLLNVCAVECRDRNKDDYIKFVKGNEKLYESIIKKSILNGIDFKEINSAFRAYLGVSYDEVLGKKQSKISDDTSSKDASYVDEDLDLDEEFNETLSKHSFRNSFEDEKKYFNNKFIKRFNDVNFTNYIVERLDTVDKTSDDFLKLGIFMNIVVNNEPEFYLGLLALHLYGCRKNFGLDYFSNIEHDEVVSDVIDECQRLGVSSDNINTVINVYFPNQIYVKERFSEKVGKISKKIKRTAPVAAVINTKNKILNACSKATDYISGYENEERIENGRGQK